MGSCLTVYLGDTFAMAWKPRSAPTLAKMIDSFRQTSRILPGMDQPHKTLVFAPIRVLRGYSPSRLLRLDPIVPAEFNFRRRMLNLRAASRTARR